MRRRDVPVVYLGELRDTGLPMLHSDERMIARMAAEHLLERGFHAFGFVGLRGTIWSERRLEFFTERLQESGRTCDVFRISRKPGGAECLACPGERTSRPGFASLSQPAAVMACYDVMGVRVLDACRNAEIAVPGAGRGDRRVDNDPLLCTLATPPLSSVAHDLDRIGHEAAALLESNDGRRVASPRRDAHRAVRRRLPPVDRRAGHSRRRKWPKRCGSFANTRATESTWTTSFALRSDAPGDAETPVREAAWAARPRPRSCAFSYDA
jgi:DNA-binding LacI/PurR family transcriptional regulator